MELLDRVKVSNQFILHIHISLYFTPLYNSPHTSSLKPPLLKNQTQSFTIPQKKLQLPPLPPLHLTTCRRYSYIAQPAILVRGYNQSTRARHNRFRRMRELSSDVHKRGLERSAIAIACAQWIASRAGRDAIAG